MKALSHAQTDNQSHSPERHSDNKGTVHFRNTSGESVSTGTLIESLLFHRERERVSFHIPGHKQRGVAADLPKDHKVDLEFDVTELDGLDDLSYPTGVLFELEARVSKLYGTETSILSVSGASGGLLASILAVSKRGSELLVPRNAHRSVIHALVLSGLKPRWYEPEWNSQWGLWQSVNAEQLDEALFESSPHAVAGVLVVSPTYAGAVSDISALAQVAHKHEVPLIVDEAQGAHFFPGLQSPTLKRSITDSCVQQTPVRMPVSACQSGADLIVHSFHKTIGAMTQTGAVHVASQNYVSAEDVRAALRLVSTSSPNYVLLSSIEHAIRWHERQEGLENLASVVALSQTLRAAFASKLEVYSPVHGFDPLHILLGSPSLSGEQLNKFFESRGIFCEAVLGAGCLLMLGCGTASSDLDLVIEVLEDLPSSSEIGRMVDVAKPEPIEQIISPREAFFASTESVPISRAGGRISADCLAPCPPGMPICVPGARVASNDVLALEGQLRVLLESG